jgi:hypothetical protein
MMESPPLFPLPVPGSDPAQWPEMLLAVTTLFLEAEHEPAEGQHSVAWVIQTRADHASGSFKRAILCQDVRPGFFAFPCWDDDYWAQRRARLTGIDQRQWARCWDAMVGAHFRRIVDPTFGATHYVNLSRYVYPPAWYRPDHVVAEYGKYTFCKVAL